MASWLHRAGVVSLSIPRPLSHHPTTTPPQVSEENVLNEEQYVGPDGEKGYLNAPAAPGVGALPS